MSKAVGKTRADARVAEDCPRGLQHHPVSQQERRRREAERAQPLEQGGGGMYDCSQDRR